MLVVKQKKAVVLKLRDPNRITTVIPTAKTFEYNGQTLVAVPHRVEETKVLRNMGFEAPAPVRYYYEWPGMYKPFHAQSETVAFLTMNQRAFCLNDLGTGKTMATLWAFDYLKKHNHATRLLVSAPLSTLERTWGDALFAMFPHLEFSVLHGTRDKRLKLLKQPADVYIINHHGMKIIADDLKSRPDIDVVIIDELSQACRNASTDMWKAHNVVCNRQSERRVWGLTGTPIPNAPTDAWAQCRLLVPSSVPPYFNRFKDQVMRQAGPFTWLPKPNAMEIVKEVMQPAIRFDRTQCVDLPPCIYQTREVELTSQQKQAYKEMMTKLKTELDGGEILAVNEAVKVSKLIQIAVGCAYDTSGNEVIYDASSRLEVTHEIIEEAGSKTLVYVPFVSGLKQVAEYLRKKGHTVEVVCGEVSKQERDRIFSDFQKRADPKVIVAQPATLSHGLTLTAASTIIWFAPITSADTYTQANGRITRPGVTMTQFIINIEGSPIERKMYDRLKNKQNAQGVLLELVKDASGT